MVKRWLNKELHLNVVVDHDSQTNPPLVYSGAYTGTYWGACAGRQLLPPPGTGYMAPLVLTDAQMCWLIGLNESITTFLNNPEKTDDAV